MVLDFTQTWLLVIAACGMTGWWLSVRPGASYRGKGVTTVNLLIGLAVILMCILALRG